MSSLCDEEEEIKAQGQFINDLKRFADQYNAYVLCVAHPRKTKPGIQMGRFDVAGSALIVNFADAAIVVERPDIRVIKSRDTGVEAKIACCYDPASRRIYQADTGDMNNFGWDHNGITPPKELAASRPEYQIQLSTNSNAMPAPF